MATYTRVFVESFGYCLPQQIVTSAELETQLAPLYERLRLPEGRLELMTGIRERRFWEPGTLPSKPSARSADCAIQAAEFDRRQIGALVHASVCRDHLEPATACTVHHALDLSQECQVYDTSNACLGMLNGMLQVANMIELGQIRAGLVVGTEGSRQLVETTVSALNQDTTLTRADAKLAVASLTIGSGSCAVLLVDESLARNGNRLRAAAVRAHTHHHGLCQSGADEAVASGMQPLMRTDSETLLVQGVETGAQTFEDFLRISGWGRDEIQAAFAHQVTSAHRKLMYERLNLDPSLDFSTVEWLGNTGSVALPCTMALGGQVGHVGAGAGVALLGIGSGINCVMLAVEWERSCAGSDDATLKSLPATLQAAVRAGGDVPEVVS